MAPGRGWSGRGRVGGGGQATKQPRCGGLEDPPQTQIGRLEKQGRGEGGVGWGWVRAAEKDEGFGAPIPGFKTWVWARWAEPPSPHGGRIRGRIRAVSGPCQGEP